MYRCPYSIRTLPDCQEAMTLCDGIARFMPPCLDLELLAAATSMTGRTTSGSGPDKAPLWVGWPRH